MLTAAPQDWTVDQVVDTINKFRKNLLDEDPPKIVSTLLKEVI